jgi:hypothetical protein
VRGKSTWKAKAFCIQYAPTTKLAVRLIPLYNTNEYPSVLIDTLPIGHICDSCNVKEYFSMIADNVQVLSNAQVLNDRGPRKGHINKWHGAKYPWISNYYVRLSRSRP